MEMIKLITGQEMKINLVYCKFNQIQYKNLWLAVHLKKDKL